MLRASVVIPARDAAATLPGTLAALARQEVDGDYEVIVVDNGSRDETAALAVQCDLGVRVIRRERGEGPGAARNAGAGAARGPILAFLDADCRPGPGWLLYGLAASRDYDLVQGRVMPDPRVELGPFDRTLAVGAANGLFESANLFVRRELFDQLGGFPGGLEAESRRGRAGAPFGEDVIFGWRARAVGARTGFCDQALAYHEVTPRGPGGFIAERARLALFPALGVRVPELRDAFFYRRVFFSRRSAAFDLALAGVALALVSKRPLGLAATAPYLRLLETSARRWGTRTAPRVAVVEVIADAVGAIALLRGSLACRSALL